MAKAGMGRLVVCAEDCTPVSRRTALRRVGGWVVFGGLASITGLAPACGRTPLGDPLGSGIGPDDDDDGTIPTGSPTPTPTPEACDCALAGAPTGLTIGDLPINTYAHRPGQGVYLCHDSLGFYAVSVYCTHAGTNMGAGAGNPGNLGNGWTCPSHGSHFDGNGERTSGPAPDGSVLTHYRVTIEQGTDEIWMDLAVIVEKDCRCTGPA